MIQIVRAGAEDLETVIAIQRASFKAVYEKYQDEYDPYLEDRERIKWKLVERPNSYYYFVKEKDEIIGFLRIQTNKELTEAWLGTAAILPQYQGKGYGRKAMELALAFIKTLPCGRAEYCWLSYEPENEVAHKLYSSFGFVETGEFDGEEVIAAIYL